MDKERRFTLRHGWGGSRARREQAFQERKLEEFEFLNHPFYQEKFGEDYVLTADDLELLQQMLAAE